MNSCRTSVAALLYLLLTAPATWTTFGQGVMGTTLGTTFNSSTKGSVTVAGVSQGSFTNSDTVMRYQNQVVSSSSQGFGFQFAFPTNFLFGIVTSPSSNLVVELSNNTGLVDSGLPFVTAYLPNATNFASSSEVDTYSSANEPLNVAFTITGVDGSETIHFNGASGTTNAGDVFIAISGSLQITPEAGSLSTAQSLRVGDVAYISRTVSQVVAVPEPSAGGLLLAGGLASLGLLGLRRL